MSFLTFKTVVLGAAGSVTSQAMLAVTGRFWICTAATAEFYIGKNDDSELSPFTLGLGYEIEQRENDFMLIKLENRTAAPNTVSLIFGRGKVTDNRLNILTTQAINVKNQDAPTLLRVTGTLTLAAAGNTLYTGTPMAGGITRRKAFHISNLDAALSLKVSDSAGVFGLSVLPQQSLVVFTDADLRVRNPGGAGVNYEVLETFYTT